MGIRKVGKLARAPLFYTLAMIRFEDQQIGLDQISGIRAKLSSAFPRFDEHKIKAVHTQVADRVIIEAKDITEYHGETATQKSGYLLRNDGLFFQTIAYEKYEAFEKMLKNVLGAVHGTLKFTHYQAIGIRYIDYIKRDSLPSIDDYVESGLLGFPLNTHDTKTVQTNCETIAEHGDFSIRLRCSKVPGRAFPIPVDLRQPAHYLDVMDKPAQESPEEDVILLDTDCFQKQLKLREFDLNATLKAFNKMHKIASNAFKMAITDEAWKEWRK